MKLMGSEIEKEFRTQLIESHKALFTENYNSMLLAVLKRLFPSMITAYVIYWIPEQGEDFYWILIDDKLVAKIEINHNKTGDPQAELVSIDEYKRGLNKLRQIQLLVAMDLARKDMDMRG
ncbi:hypothetical protein SAMN05518672_11219 [Chitinophaga sp. CF118]|uniref:hypothetical protein n=1 Tax=Chitinophaga sp. CF118 TaxID=1884367 RepID=UPI0008EB5958|nr:hypothetical protein [Chitinophaga sp. CF118]SFE91105.1 hypothetical protein SAMN05518672_11219 [Chitinophaga sp. CF118]